MTIRKSRQRDKILDVIKKATNHPTAEHIYLEVRKSMPRISLGTVYRNLNLLAETEQIQEIICSDRVSRYQWKIDDDYHLKCRRCENIFDMNGTIKKDLNEVISGTHSDYDITHHRIEFYGFCNACKRTTARHKAEEDCLLSPAGVVTDDPVSIPARTIDYSEGGLGVRYPGAVFSSGSIFHVDIESLHILDREAKVAWSKLSNGESQSGLQWI